MTLSRRLLRVYHYPANIVSWTLFATVGVLLNIGCAPLHEFNHLLGQGRNRECLH